MNDVSVRPSSCSFCGMAFARGMLGPSVAICCDCVELARALLEGPGGEVRAPSTVRYCPICEQALAPFVHEGCKGALLTLLVETEPRRREAAFDLYLSPDFDERVERSMSAMALEHDETSSSTYADLARAYAELGMGQDVLVAVVCALRTSDACGTAYGAAVEALSVYLERRGLDVRERLDALARGS